MPTRVAPPSRSCRWYEVYLSAYWSKPVQIDHILTGCNLASGYPYYVFGYRDKS